MRISRKLGALCVASTSLILLAACGNSSQPSASASGVQGSSGDAAQVAAARTAEANYSKAPTGLSVTTPLKTRPPVAGKTVVYLQCSVASCKLIGDAVTAAAKAAGWTAKILNFDVGSPASLVSAMKTALQYHPVAVGLSALPQAVWQQEIPAYKAAGVIIVPVSDGPITFSSTVPATAVGNSTSNLEGSEVASWVIADSNGKANSLIVNVPSSGSINALAAGINNAINTGCSQCKTSTLNATAAQQTAGQVNTLVVSALRRHPSIDYVLGAYAPTIAGLNVSLQTAGLASRVKIGGAAVEIQGESELVAGTASAFAAQGQAISGWFLMDAALRHFEGMNFPPNWGLAPSQLLTKASMASSGLQPANDYLLPQNFQGDFEKLWKVQ